MIFSTSFVPSSKLGFNKIFADGYPNLSDSHKEKFPLMSFPKAHNLKFKSLLIIFPSLMSAIDKLAGMIKFSFSKIFRTTGKEVLSIDSKKFLGQLFQAR